MNTLKRQPINPKKYLLLIAMYAWSTAVWAQPLSEQQVQNIVDQQFKPLLEQYRIAGLAVGVTLNGNIILSIMAWPLNKISDLSITRPCLNWVRSVSYLMPLWQAMHRQRQSFPFQIIFRQTVRNRLTQCMQIQIVDLRQTQ